jgi:serine-type D-Ala-D-Ala carboxypeptidase (penicillin-binding protein 5/6)
MPVRPALNLTRFRMARVVLIGALALILATPPRDAAAIETSAREAILVDMETGAVLFEKNPDELMPPASMSKIMTSYLAFERVQKGEASLDDEYEVSANAWRKGGAASGGSTMFLDVGQRVRLEDLLRGIIVQSGNDASIVVAEGMAGSEEAFAEQMTEQARLLGLNQTTFRNATGLPHEDHLTTARDLAKLARHTILDHPEFYHYYAEKEFTFNGIHQGNRNPLLYEKFGADGLKTGHTQASGFGLTASVQRDGRRLILVLNGLPSMQSRADESRKMFDYAFREFDNKVLARADTPVTDAEVWLGEQGRVPLVVDGDWVVTLPRGAGADMRVSAVYDGPVPAPVTKGQPIGVLRVDVEGQEPQEVPLVAADAVPKLGLFRRMMFAVGYGIDRVLN